MLTRVAWVSFAACLLAGCKGPQPAPLATPSDVRESGITLVDSTLLFVKSWSVTLSNGRVLKVTAMLTPWMSLYEGGVEFNDQVSQSDGNWIVFDCDNIADKIIEPGLVTQLAQWCPTLHSAAMTYWKANGPPAYFTDNSGRTWILKR